MAYINCFLLFGPVQIFSFFASQPQACKRVAVACPETTTDIGGSSHWSFSVGIQSTWKGLLCQIVAVSDGIVPDLFL